MLSITAIAVFLSSVLDILPLLLFAIYSLRLSKKSFFANFFDLSFLKTYCLWLFLKPHCFKFKFFLVFRQAHLHQILIYA